MAELALVKQVEFKLLLIDDPDKFTQALDLYLAPLLLKLASPAPEVRTKVLEILKHINSRLRNSKLPLPKLIAQLHEPTVGSSIKTMDLVYISKAIAGTIIDTGVLADLTRNISVHDYQVAKGQFSIFLTALCASKSVEFTPAETDLEYLLTRTTQLMMIDLKFLQKGSCPGLGAQDFQFLTYNLNETKLSASKAKVVQWWTALSKSLPPKKLFIPLLVSQQDRLNEVWSPSRTLFKNLGLQSFDCTPDIAKYLASLCIPTNAMQPVKLELLVSIFDILSKAEWSAVADLDLHALVYPALKSTSKPWVQSALKLLRTGVQKGELGNAADYAQEVYNYIYTVGISYGNTNSDVRSSAYETLGMLLTKSPVQSLQIINFLLQSLERDAVTMVPSIQSALSEVMKLPVPEDLKPELSKILLRLFLSSERDGSKYVAVRYMIRAFPFLSVEARLTCLLALTITSRSDIVDEGKRGTDPYLFGLEHGIDSESLEFPDSASMCQCINENIKQITNPGPAVAFVLKCIGMEGGMYVMKDQKFDETFWISIEHDESVYRQLKVYLEDKDVELLLDLCLPGLLADDASSTRVWAALTKVAPKQSLDTQTKHIPALLTALNGNGPISTISESIATIYPGDLMELVNELNAALTPNKALLLAYLVKIRGIKVDIVNYCIQNKLWDVVYQLALAESITPTIELTNALNLVDEKSMLAFGALSLCDSDNAEKYVEKLMAVSTNSRNIDYLLSNGEAISIASSGWSSQLLRAEKHISNSPTVNMSGLLKRIFKDAKASPVNRRYACVRLLCLCQYNRAQIEPFIEDIQSCFLMFLSDADEISQESASRGLGVLFEYSDKTTQQSLVQRLVLLFTDDATKTLGGGRISDETELFQPGALNTGDGSVSTYKDVLNLANEVGDTSLVYKFMSLASSSQLWSTKRGAVFGLENIMARADIGADLISPQSQIGRTLIPKLFRYQFDGNSTVKATMKSIWDSLVKSPQKTIADHFKSILDELIAGTSNYEWRVRQASTLALANLVETSDWKSFSGEEETLWKIGFRMVDDIKESVREAGFQLTKALVSVLTRRLDSESSGNTQLLQILIPFLFSTKGIHNESDEVKGFALSALLKIALSTSKDVKPFHLDMVHEFTLLLSDLEPQAMNYVALNSSNYGVDSSVIDDARLQGVKRSPILETVEKMVDRLDNDQMCKVLNSWPAIVRKAVGLPSDVGASRIIVSICMRYPTNTTTDPLIKACFKKLTNRNTVVAQSYATALAYLCNLAPLDTIVRYTNDLISIYFDPVNDEKTRLICAYALNKLSLHSNDKLLSVSSLSLAFVAVGKHDGDPSVALLFQKTWDSNTGGTESLRLYSSDIVELAASWLSSPSWNLRGTAARAIGECAPCLKKTPDSLVEKLLQGLEGRTWAGKEYVFIALAYSSSNLTGDHQSQAISRVTNELKRNNGDYVCAILPAAGKFVKHHYNSHLTDLYFSKVLAALSDELTTEDKLDEDRKAKLLEGAISAYTGPEQYCIDPILLKLLVGWKLKEATCKGIPQLAEHGYYSPVVWNNLCKLCGEDYGHEIVRLAWVEAAAAWKSKDAVSHDVRRILEREQSSAVIAMAHSKGFV